MSKYASAICIYIIDSFSTKLNRESLKRYSQAHPDPDKKYTGFDRKKKILHLLRFVYINREPIQDQLESNAHNLSLAAAAQFFTFVKKITGAAINLPGENEREKRINCTTALYMSLRILM